jgi:hypothetical protein
VRERRLFWRSCPSATLAASLAAATVGGILIGLHGVAELAPLPLAESAFILVFAAGCSLGPNDLVKAFLTQRALHGPRRAAPREDDPPAHAIPLEHAPCAMSKTKHRDASSAKSGSARCFSDARNEMFARTTPVATLLLQAHPQGAWEHGWSGAAQMPQLALQHTWPTLQVLRPQSALKGIVGPLHARCEHVSPRRTQMPQLALQHT